MLILPLAFLVVGLALGGGLYYVSHRMRARLKSIQDARTCKAADAAPGRVKMHGTVKAVDPGDLLISPIEQQPCVYYRLVIDQWRSSGVTISSSSRPTSKSAGSWVRVIEDVQAIPMVVADETGAVSVNPKEAELDFKSTRRHAGLFTSLPKGLEASLREKYKVVTSSWLLPNEMRYTEVVIAPDTDVFVVGDCEVDNGQARLTRKDHPLIMSFRKEEEVVRNGKIRTTVCTAAAVASALLFTTLAAYIFSVLPGSGPNVANAAGKVGTPNEAIAKLKDTSASLSDRAAAARKLADSPVQKNRVDEVAPYLNPLLDSKDGSDRDSALQAIKQGWGSAVNEPFLNRILQDTKDSRVRKEVAAALKRIES